jgi:hypothetical protein
MSRRLRLAAPFIALALVVAGCGGSKVVVQEVPGGAVDLGVPGGGAALNPAATATPTPTVSATPTATTTGASSSGTTGTTSTSQQSASTTTGSTSGGTQAPSTTSTGAATATPAPGSPTQQYEDFCAQNPGAC